MWGGQPERNGVVTKRVTVVTFQLVSVSSMCRSCRSCRCGASWRTSRVGSTGVLEI